MSQEFSVAIERDEETASSLPSHLCRVAILRPDRSTSLWSACERQLP